MKKGNKKQNENSSLISPESSKQSAYGSHGQLDSRLSSIASRCHSQVSDKPRTQSVQTSQSSAPTVVQLTDTSVTVINKLNADGSYGSAESVKDEEVKDDEKRKLISPVKDQEVEEDSNGYVSLPLVPPRPLSRRQGVHGLSIFGLLVAAWVVGPILIQWIFSDEHTKNETATAVLLIFVFTALVFWTWLGLSVSLRFHFIDIVPKISEIALTPEAKVYIGLSILTAIANGVSSLDEENSLMQTLNFLSGAESLLQGAVMTLILACDKIWMLRIHWRIMQFFVGALQVWNAFWFVIDVVEVFEPPFGDLGVVCLAIAVDFRLHSLIFMNALLNAQVTEEVWKHETVCIEPHAVDTPDDAPSPTCCDDSVIENDWMLKLPILCGMPVIALFAFGLYQVNESNCSVLASIIIGGTRLIFLCIAGAYLWFRFLGSNESPRLSNRRWKREPLVTRIYVMFAVLSLFGSWIDLYQVQHTSSGYYFNLLSQAIVSLEVTLQAFLLSELMQQGWIRLPLTHARTLLITLTVLAGCNFFQCAYFIFRDEHRVKKLLEPPSVAKYFVITGLIDFRVHSFIYAINLVCTARWKSAAPEQPQQEANSEANVGSKSIAGQRNVVLFFGSHSHEDHV